MDIKTVSAIKVRVVGVVLLLLVMGIDAAHAFSSTTSMGYFDSLGNAFVGAGLMMTGIFVVLGFGLTLAYFN